MAVGKWIGGFLGFITTGSPLGALAGFTLGALFDAGMDAVNTTDNTSYSAFGNTYSGADARQRIYEGQRLHHQSRRTGNAFGDGTDAKVPPPELR